MANRHQRLATRVLRANDKTHCRELLRQTNCPDQSTCFKEFIQWGVTKFIGYAPDDKKTAREIHIRKAHGT